MNAKSIGIFGLLLGLFLFMIFMTSDPWYDITGSTFLLPNNIENLLRRISMYGLLGIGVAMVIITSGIDLSVGSIVCLAGCLLGIFLQVDYRAADSFDIFKVDSSAMTVTVHGDAGRTIQPGDPLRLYRGRTPAILKAKSIEKVMLGDDEGNPIGVGSIIQIDGTQVDGTLTRDDRSGQLAKGFAVKQFTEATDDSSASTTLVDLPVPLDPRDKVVFFHPTMGIKEMSVTAAKQVGDLSTVEFDQPLGNNFSDQWYAMPMKRHQRMSIPFALLSVLGIAGLLGWVHGLLVTRVHLQPFVVTLCGLLIYRGFSRWLVDDNPVGFGIEYKETLSPLGSGKLQLFEWSSENAVQTFGIPYPFFVFIIVAIVAAVFLNRTVWGRYLLALGSNEEAARYSGIRTERVTIMAYVICTMCAAIGGILFALDSGSISPSSFGNFYELYAIAAAVLGGCSLRGGEGSIFGVIGGTAVMMLLNNLILLLKIADRLEFTIIGLVILLGVFLDETVRRVASRRRTRVS
jgi:ribose transport system permease protein